jgi:hypothetical protein
VPDVGEVPRQPARHKEDGVNADVIPGAHESRGEALRRHRDAAQPILIERHGGAVLAAARPHLDEGDDPAAPGY